MRNLKRLARWLRGLLPDRRKIVLRRVHPVKWTRQHSIHMREFWRSEIGDALLTLMDDKIFVEAIGRGSDRQFVNGMLYMRDYLLKMQADVRGDEKEAFDPLEDAYVEWIPREEDEADLGALASL